MTGRNVPPQIGSTHIMPHDADPLWVWHVWLCHPDKSTCEDGCDHQADSARRKLYEAVAS